MTAERPFGIAIAATFVADPIEVPLREMLERLGIHAEIGLAPQNQVFQQVLDPESILGRNSGLNLLLTRTRDWGPDAAGELEAAVQGLRRRNPSPVVVLTDEDYARLAHESGCPEFQDPIQERAGNVPFTQQFFTILAAEVARRVHALAAAPRKAIIVDCDDTLWAGVCAEVGPENIRFNDIHCRFQNYLVDLAQKGILICLASRNNAEDVMAVFDTHSEMPLRKSHITAYEISWSRKAHGIERLARRLSLGLDAFVFVDNDAMECAEVRARCPEVVVLRFPFDWNRLWAFDGLGHLTSEDHQRSRFYREENRRQQERAGAATLEEFIASLDLTVTMRPLTAADAARAAQLSIRTNQFNLNGARHTEADILAACQSGAICRSVEAKDRFGDYGHVGLMICTPEGEELKASTFLLSCRALGRGVEYRMIEYLSQLAGTLGLCRVRLPYVRTERNIPAARFLNSLGISCTNGTASGAVSAQFRWDGRFPSSGTLEDQVVFDSATIRSGAVQDRARAIESIASAVEPAAAPVRRRPDWKPDSPAASYYEELSIIWRRLLRTEAFGIDDNFFQLGGYSVLLVRMVSEIHEAFGVEIPLFKLFDAATIRTMAEVIIEAQIDAADPDEVKRTLDAIRTGRA